MSDQGSTTNFASWLREYYKWCQQERATLVEPVWGMAYDAFMGRYSSQWLDKWKSLEGNDWRCKVFVRFGRRKVISAVAQIEDVLFQGGGFPYNIKPTPVPEDARGMVLPKEIAQARSELMSKKIEDVLVECKYDRTLRSSILEKAIYGMSVHKCPVIKQKRKMQYQLQIPRLASGIDMVFGSQLAMKYARHSMVPTDTSIAVVEHHSIWDVFWDMEADNFQEGMGVCIRKMMSPGMLDRMKGKPGFDDAAIDRVVSAVGTQQYGAGAKTGVNPERGQLGRYKNNIEVVEFWGRVPVKELRNSSGYEAGSFYNLDTDAREVEVTAVVAFGSGIDAVEIRPVMPNNLPLEHRPVHEGFWEDTPHSTIGVGILENIQDATLMINGGYRSLIDNKALSSNLMLAYIENALTPGQNLNPRTGGKIELQSWVQDINKAVQWFSPPDTSDGLINMINLAERFGDEDSGHPRLMQGETAKHQPNTAFEMSQLVQAANKQLGRCIRNQDEQQIEPDIESIYHFLMATDPDENVKGDYQVQATGFAAYSDRVLKGQELIRLIQFQLSNENMARLLRYEEASREAWKVASFDPDQFLMTQEEADMLEAQKMMALAAMMPPPAGNENPAEPSETFGPMR